jgi:hypothetical protein
MTPVTDKCGTRGTCKLICLDHKEAFVVQTGHSYISDAENTLYSIKTSRMILDKQHEY